MSRRGRAWIGAMALCAGWGTVFLAAPARALELYRFTDARGVVHLTNLPPVDPRFSPVASRGVGARGTAPANHRYDALIQRISQSHAVAPGLVKAVIAAESNFDASAISRVGARGLMQLMPSTAREFGVQAPFEPEANVRGGVRYLRSMLVRYGDIQRALAAYNAGPEAVDRHGGVPPYVETQDYVARVLNYYRRYDGEFGR